MKLDGNVALITGGASGLGKATVETLVEAGCTTVIFDLPSSQGADVAKELGDRVLFAAGDVTSEEDVSSAVALAEDAGPLRIAVNCAGVGWPSRIVDREGAPMALDFFENVVRVNLNGTFNVARLAAASMMKIEPQGEERGLIVNTASIAAFDGQIGQVSYAASKGGVVGMTLPMARDLSSAKIRVVTIAPGTFDTPMLAMLPQENRDALAAQIPHPRRLGDPREYGALVKHIAENAAINGEVIRIDGALRMAPK